MKLPIVAGLALATFLFAQPSFAETDPSTAASDYGSKSALSLIAAPVYLTAAGVALTVGAGEQVVKVVDKAGEGLSELTEEALNQTSMITNDLSDVMDDSLNEMSSTSDVQQTKPKEKKIPLAVRKDYLQLNQKVKSE